MEPPKDHREDAKLRDLPDEELEILWRFRHPEPGGKKIKMSYIAAVEVPTRYGVTIALSSLSSFYKWLQVRRDFRESRDVVYQIKEELKRDTAMSMEEIERAGVVMLAAGGVSRKDGKLFAAMVKLGQNRDKIDQGKTKLDQNEKRLKQTDKSLEMEARRVAMLEAKANRMDALEAKAKEIKAAGGLSPETLEMLEKQLKLL